MLELKKLLTTDLLEENNKNIQGLTNKLNEGNPLEFIIGAGVTVSIGFPTWVELLSRAIGREILFLNDTDDFLMDEDEKRTKTISGIISESSTAKEKWEKGLDKGYSDVFFGRDMLEIAEYVLNTIRDRTGGTDEAINNKLAKYRVTELVADCLRMSEAAFDRRLIKKYDGSTIEAIVDIIKRMYDTEKTYEVLTYNYDNCIELCLEKKANVPAENIVSISYTDKDIRPKDGKINVAHVHGKINVINRDDISDEIILTESSYRNMEKTEYMWQNTVQAKAMLEKPCLFVGFSALDYNFRRIMKNSKNVKNTYIIFTIDEIIRNVCNEALKMFAIKDIKKKINKKIKKNEYIVDDKELDAEQVAKKYEDKYLKNIFEEQIKDKKNEEYKHFGYERLFIEYLVASQTNYWEKHGIKPIWTTIDEIPGLIREIGSAY